MWMIYEHDLDTSISTDPGFLASTVPGAVGIYQND